MKHIACGPAFSIAINEFGGTKILKYVISTFINCDNDIFDLPLIIMNNLIHIYLLIFYFYF